MKPITVHNMPCTLTGGLLQLAHQSLCGRQDHGFKTTFHLRVPPKRDPECFAFDIMSHDLQYCLHAIAH
jgi:hypothetical protein